MLHCQVVQRGCVARGRLSPDSRLEISSVSQGSDISWTAPVWAFCGVSLFIEMSALSLSPLSGLMGSSSLLIDVGLMGTSAQSCGCPGLMGKSRFLG